jgi:hypothetical protein
MGDDIMYTKRRMLVGRSVTALAIASAIALGGAGIASASGHHDHGVDGANCASGRLSSFDYANDGTGGYVTAVTATSVTIDPWHGATSTYTIAPSTTVDVGSAAATAASIVVGDRVNIQVASSDPTTATSITVELAMLFGTVTTVSGNAITITDPQGFTRTINVSSATTYENGGNAGSLADVVVGAKIIARGTVDANGTTLDAVGVDIGSAGSEQFVTGTVTSVTGSSVTIESQSNTPSTFTLTSNTLYGDGPLSLSLADLVVGSQVGVEFDSSASTTAVRIDIRLAHVEGQVTTVGGSTITIAGNQGTSDNIVVSPSTLYFQGRSSASLADVVVGTRVIATGTADSDGTSLDALSVVIWTPVVSSPSPQGNGWNNFGNGGNHSNDAHGNSGQSSFGQGNGSRASFGRGGHDNFGGHEHQGNFGGHNRR